MLKTSALAKPPSCAEKRVTARLPDRATRFHTSGFVSANGYPVEEDASGCYRTLPLATEE